MIKSDDFKLPCIDRKKAREKVERFWCKEYDEGFDFIDEYCEDCLEYQKFVYKMLPEVKEMLEGMGE